MRQAPSSQQSILSSGRSAEVRLSQTNLIFAAPLLVGGPEDEEPRHSTSLSPHPQARRRLRSEPSAGDSEGNSFLLRYGIGSVGFGPELV